MRISFLLESLIAVGKVKEKKKKAGWLWPLGLMATGLAGAAVMVARGCWHTHMSWPVRAQNHSYQVCTGCGIKRLFDVNAFASYGPYSYDIDRLIAWDRTHPKRLASPPAKRPA